MSNPDDAGQSARRAVRTARLFDGHTGHSGGPVVHLVCCSDSGLSLRKPHAVPGDPVHDLNALLEISTITRPGHRITGR